MRVTGLVKWFDVRHGCGVIVRHDGAADCLVRHSGMEGTGLRILAAGAAVEFAVTDGRFGPMAVNVIRILAHHWGPAAEVERHASADR